MIVLIDNYGTSTYNLAQAFGLLRADVRVFGNDAITVDQIAAMNPSHIVISSGPGGPDDGGISLDVISTLGHCIPTLGICLGHQCIGQSFGGQVVRAPRLMHGKTASIYHYQTLLFSGVPSPFEATCYHSLMVDESSLRARLKVTAFTAQGEIMGLKHVEYPIVGLQFHPESILTSYGPRILKNFLENKL